MDMAFQLDELELPTLTKFQLAHVLADEIGLSFREARSVVDGFFDILAQELIDGHSVKLSKFGNFNVLMKRPRPGRNPRSGEPVLIAARRSVCFLGGRKLEELMHQKGALKRHRALKASLPRPL